jgi:hypothetical protein
MTFLWGGRWEAANLGRSRLSAGSGRLKGGCGQNCPPSNLAAMLLCLTLAGCGGLTRHGPVDPVLAAFISPDSVALAGVRMDQIRTTPIYRKLAEGNRLPRFDQFHSEDIHDVLLASDGKNVLAIGRGDFRAKPPDGLTPTEYRGYTVYVNNGRDAIVFLDRTTALAGSAAAVRAAIDQYKGGGHGAPRDLMARAQALPADAQIWAVVVGWRGATPDQLREMGNLGNVDRMLRAVDGAKLTVDLRTGVHAAVTGDCRTEADARNLGDSLRGLAALARMGVQRMQPDLLRVFDAIQVKQEGRVVQVNLDIAEDLAEKLIR